MLPTLKPVTSQPKKVLPRKPPISAPSTPTTMLPEDAEPAAAHRHTGQPARDQADQQPRNDAHE